MLHSLLAGLALALAPMAAMAQEATPPPGLDERINALVGPIADALSSVIFVSVPVAGAQLPLIVVWLIAAALFFTVYLGFINIRGFGHAVRLAKGDYSDPNDAGEVSHFQALATALSGTVGLGNIAGVAVAVGIGGIKPIANVTGNLVPFMGMPTCSAGPGARASSERPFPTRPRSARPPSRIRRSAPRSR